MLLGPVILVNHDCDANCKYITFNGDVYLETRKPIQKGQELTVFYDNDYFGNSNEYCQCLTCENNSQGAFRSRKAMRKNEVIESCDISIIFILSISYKFWQYKIPCDQ